MFVITEFNAARQEWRIVAFANTGDEVASVLRHRSSRAVVRVFRVQPVDAAMFRDQPTKESAGAEAGERRRDETDGR